MYQFGMVDENEKAYIDNATQQGVTFMKNKDFYQAFLVKISTVDFKFLGSFLNFFVSPQKFVSTLVLLK